MRGNSVLGCRQQRSKRWILIFAGIEPVMTGSKPIVDTCIHGTAVYSVYPSN